MARSSLPAAVRVDSLYDPQYRGLGAEEIAETVKVSTMFARTAARRAFHPAMNWARNGCEETRISSSSQQSSCRLFRRQGCTRRDGSRLPHGQLDHACVDVPQTEIGHDVFPFRGGVAIILFQPVRFVKHHGDRQELSSRKRRAPMNDLIEEVALAIGGSAGDPLMWPFGEEPSEEVKEKLRHMARAAIRTIAAALSDKSK